MKNETEQKLKFLSYVFFGAILLIFLITLYTFISYHQIYNNHSIKHTKKVKKIKVPKFISGEHSIYLGNKYNDYRLFDTLKTISLIQNDSLVINFNEYDTLHISNSYNEKDEQNYLIYISSLLFFNDFKKFKIETNFILNEFVNTYGKKFKIFKNIINDNIIYSFIWEKSPNLINLEISISNTNFIKLLDKNNIDFNANINIELIINNLKDDFGKELDEIQTKELLKVISD